MQKHQGMTLIGMLLTMAVVIISGVVMMRIVPVYIEQYELVSSMKALSSLPPTEFTTDPSTNAGVLKSKLLSQLYINSIESITPEQITIVPNEKGDFQVTVKYQVIRPLVANIRLLFDFEASQEVHVSAE